MACAAMIRVSCIGLHEYIVLYRGHVLGTFTTEEAAQRFADTLRKTT